LMWLIIEVSLSVRCDHQGAAAASHSGGRGRGPHCHRGRPLQPPRCTPGRGPAGRACRSGGSDGGSGSGGCGGGKCRGASRGPERASAGPAGREPPMVRRGARRALPRSAEGGAAKSGVRHSPRRRGRAAVSGGAGVRVRRRPGAGMARRAPEGRQGARRGGPRGGARRRAAGCGPRGGGARRAGRRARRRGARAAAAADPGREGEYEQRRQRLWQ